MSVRTRVAWSKGGIAVAAVAATTMAITGGGTAGGAAGATAMSHRAALPSARSLNRGAQHVPVRESDTPSPHTLPAGVPKTGSYTFLVKLGATPALTVFNRARAHGSSVRTAGKAASSQEATIAAAQRTFVAKLPTKASVLYRIHSVMAGVAVNAPVSDYRALWRIPNVTAVYPVAPKSISTSYAVPFQNGPAAWADLPSGADGQAGKGVRIADIDTGLDYTHADFGGPGTTAAYADAKASATPPAADYDAAKFDAADSYDLVGDSYDSDPDDATYQPVPQPDDNPLDCDGHGTHTAGIAAGFGIKAGSSSAYTGSYGASTVSTSDASAWKIGPGMAPLATLISFRVFGCAGSSSEVGHALDMAIDLNTDGNPNNDVDVINMSLGSDYAPADDGDAVLADDAVNAGINVAVASGNDDDVVDMGGSPGDAPQVLTVAASGDAQEVDDATNFTISGDPDGLDGTYVGASSRSLGYAWGQAGEIHGGGDMSGPVVLLAENSTDGKPDACSPLTGDYTGKIVAIPAWNDNAPECGSITRGKNVAAAGGIGFIFLSSRNSISAGINGDFGPDGIADNGTPNGGSGDTTNSNDAIPGVLMVAGATTGTPTDSALLKKALQDGATVTVTGTAANAATHLDPSLNDSLADFSSRGTHAAGDLKPDVSAVGLTVSSAASGTGSDAVTESGTSMATPMVAGLAALVVGEHGAKTPDHPSGWTPEMVKADIMNTADHDLRVDGPTGATYAPNRVGSGRIDADAALKNQVLAYDGDDAGTVSVSFGPVEIPVDQPTPFTALKTIKVTNTGTTDETYHVAYDATDAMPGVDYHLSTDSGGGTLTVPAGTTQRIVVTLEIDDPTKLDKSVDASYWTRDPQSGVVMDQNDGVPAETLADASGNVVLTPSDSAPTLRVPVYSAPRPASDLSIPSRVLVGSTGKGTVTPKGAGLAQGLDDDGDGNDTDESNDIFSIAAGFELQATSPALPKCATDVTTDSNATVPNGCVFLDEDRGVDLKYVGTTSDYPTYPAKVAASESQVYFGLGAWGTNSTPTGRNEDDIFIDTNGDGKPDLDIANTTLGYPDTAVPVYVADVYDLDVDPAKTDPLIDQVPLNDRFGDVDTAIFDSDVLMIPVPVADLEKAGLQKGKPISYAVVTYDDDYENTVDEVGTDEYVPYGAVPTTLSGALTMNPFTPAVQVTEQGVGPLLDDQDNYPLDVSVNRAQYAKDGGLGLMFMHFHNMSGSKVQIAKIATESMKLAVSTKPRVGTKSTLTVTVSGDAATPATGTVVIKQGSVRVGTVKLRNGTGKLSWTPKWAGRVPLAATYSGNGYYSPDRVSRKVSVAARKPPKKHTK